MERGVTVGTTLWPGEGKMLRVALLSATSPRIETIVAESVFVWPNGYLTVYQDKGDSESFAIYPPHRVLSIRAEAKR